MWITNIYRTLSQVTLFKDGSIIKLKPGTILTNLDVPGSNDRYYHSIHGGLIPEKYIHDTDLFEEAHIDALLNYVSGDLVKDAKKYDAIVHGANCFCTFGAGIALGIAKNFPQAEQVDASTKSGEKSKLGGLTTSTDGDLTIINAYTQFNPGSQERGEDKERSRYIREWAIRKSMRAIKKNFSGKKIAMPLIGAGIAGGSWERIERIILEELYGEDVTIVIWARDSEMFFEQTYGSLLDRSSESHLIR